uniref:Mucin 13, cell surface associated n=2 Tax=Suricata suricatta TaxID=37032 RepID=A0A673SX83_SURSU
MKASPHLALLILLFVASAIQQITAASNSSSTTTATNARTTPPASSVASVSTLNTTLPSNPLTNNTTNASTTTTPTTPPASSVASVSTLKTTLPSNPLTNNTTNASTTTPTTPPASSVASVSTLKTTLPSNPLTNNTTNASTTTTPTTPPASSVASVSIVSSVATTTVLSTSKSSADANTTAPTPGSTSSGSNESAPVVTSPGLPTTQKDTGSSLVTVPQSNSSETVPSVTSGSVTSPKISTPNTASPGSGSLCQGAPCKGSSSCVGLNTTHFCLCSLGYYYDSSTCQKGKLFPGKITVKISETSGLGDKNSMDYQKLHVKVTNFFKSAFNKADFGQTVINEMSISPSARLETRTSDKDVAVEVVNIFALNAKVDEGSVTELIEKAIHDSTDGVTRYTPQNLCDFYNCEKENEKDNCDSGLLCKCKQGMERPNPQIPACVASAPKCPDNCNADHNKQCLVNKNGGNAECVCLSGYQKDDHGNCQACAFGYSGVNCEDRFQLILTIVGTIMGVLILGLVIGLIFSVRSKNSHKNIEEQNLIDHDFQNLRLKQTTGFSNLGADGGIFPKIRTNVSSQLHNPYANQRSMPRPDY